MVSRIVTGARYGLRDWLAQRITAVVMALYTLVFAVAIFNIPTLDYEHWRNLFAGSFMRFATFLFFVSLFYHAWVGVRDIFMDYIKSAALRLSLHVLVIVALAGYMGWATQILWRL